MHTMQKFFQSPNLRIALWIAIITLPWTIAFYYTPLFEVNDDAANIILFREVFGAGSADSSIFVSSIFTHGLIALYRINANIPWYSLLVLFSLGSAQLLLLHLVVRAKISTLFRVCLLVAITVITFRLIISCSFTASALLLSSTALLYGILKSCSKTWYTTFLFAVFLSVGFLLRPTMFPVAALTFIPVLSAVVLSKALSVRNAFGYCLIVLAIIGSLYVADLLVESEVRNNFKQTNSTRAMFSDTAWGAVTSDFKKASSAAEWSIADYIVVRDLWWYMDDSVHSPDSVERFIQTNQAGGYIPWNIKELIHNYSDVHSALILYTLLLVGWMVFEKGFRSVWLWTTVVLGLLCLFLLAGIRFPPRVAYPFFLMLALAPMAGASIVKPRRITFNLVTGTFLIVMLVPFFYAIYIDVQDGSRARKSNDIMRRALESELQSRSQLEPETLFVAMLPGASEINFVEPFNWKGLYASLRVDGAKSR